MNGRVLYFAYGSNTNRTRMLARVPDAVEIGTATLPGWRLVERLYADIEPCDGSAVDGVLWDVGPDGIAALDRCEGFPSVYGSVGVKVRIGRRGNAMAMAYAMTDETRRERDGVPYPGWYRDICAEGAREHGIRSGFGAVPGPDTGNTIKKEVAR